MCFKCSDPWVDEAIRQVTAGGIPMGCGNCGACNIQLYNGGLWHSYAELLRYVDEALRAMSSAKVRFKMVGGQFVVGRDGIPNHVFAHQSIVLPADGQRRSPTGLDLTSGRVLGSGSILSDDSAGFISDQGGGFAKHASAISDHGAGFANRSGVANRASIISDNGGGFANHASAIGDHGAGLNRGGGRGLLSAGAQMTTSLGKSILVLS